MDYPIFNSDFILNYVDKKISYFNGCKIFDEGTVINFSYNTLTNSVKAIVVDDYYNNVRISFDKNGIKMFECDCQKRNKTTGICEHVIATLKKLQSISMCENGILNSDNSATQFVCISCEKTYDSSRSYCPNCGSNKKYIHMNLGGFENFNSEELVEKQDLKISYTLETQNNQIPIAKSNSTKSSTYKNSPDSLKKTDPSNLSKTSYGSGSTYKSSTESLKKVNQSDLGKTSDGSGSTYKSSNESLKKVNQSDLGKTSDGSEITNETSTYNQKNTNTGDLDKTQHENCFKSYTQLDAYVHEMYVDKNESVITPNGPTLNDCLYNGQLTPFSELNDIPPQRHIKPKENDTDFNSAFNSTLNVFAIIFIFIMAILFISLTISFLVQGEYFTAVNLLLPTGLSTYLLVKLIISFFKKRNKK